MDIFWSVHNPHTRSWSVQYACAVFHHDDDQERVALESLKRIASLSKGEIFTKVVRAKKFYLAEDYHQKYRLQNDGILVRDFRNIYSDAADIVNSTAAARVNGYLHGYGSPQMVRDDLPLLGLSPAGKTRLLEVVSGRRATAHLRGAAG